MQCDAAKIKDLRRTRAMTQEKLAKMSNVERRTVQRAEAGEAVSLETLAFLSAALGVPADHLLAPAVPTASDDHPLEETTTAMVTARKATSARKLLAIIKSARLGTLDYEVEPDPSNLPVLRKIVGTFAGLMPLDPWDEQGARQIPGGLLAELECIAALGEQLKELEQNGLAVFAGEHVEFAVMPRYDSEEGHLFTRTNQTPELVRIVRLVIGPDVTERLKVIKEREWSVRVLADDEIPF